MNRNSIGVIIVLVIVAGGWYLISKAPEGESSTVPTSQVPVIDNTTPDTIVETKVSGATVRYTDQEFSPETITIARGETVTWVNQSSKNMWVASAAHPTHMVYDGTSLKDHCVAGAEAPFDACRAFSPDEPYTFTFDKVGTWKYHDHIDASKRGSVIVTAAP